MSGRNRKSLPILVKPEYEEPFSEEWKKSKQKKKDFLMEIANEFISDKGLDMEKIELPKVKRGRKTIHHTEEERKEAKRVTQKKYLENTRKNKTTHRRIQKENGHGRRSSPDVPGQGVQYPAGSFPAADAAQMELLYTDYPLGG